MTDVFDDDDDDLEAEIETLSERQKLAVDKAIQDAHAQGYRDRKKDEDIEKFGPAVKALAKLTERTWPIDECTLQCSKDELEDAIYFLNEVLKEKERVDHAAT